MRLSLILVLILIIGTASRAFAVQTQRQAIDPEVKVEAKIELPSLEALPAASTFSRTDFQKAYPELTDDEQASKWKAASASPMHLIRSYVNIWYDDAAKLKNPGPIGPCFGDAHIDNFGYLWFDDQSWHYTYNDLDDVGTCPVLFDALRFFTTLNLLLNDPAAEDQIRLAYIDFLNGKVLTKLPSDAYTPELKSVMKRNKEDDVQDGSLIMSDDDIKIGADLKDTIFGDLDQVIGSASGLTFKDMFQYSKAKGGSAGLECYEILAKDANKDDHIFELKQLVNPGSERGPWATHDHLTRESFVDLLWGANKPASMRFLKIANKSFQLRSLERKSANIEKLHDSEMVDMLTEEVYIMAQIHRRTLKGSPELAQWLQSNTALMVDRYTFILQNIGPSF